MRVAALAALLGLAGLPSDTPAADAGPGRAGVGLSGSIRELLTVSQGTDRERFERALLLTLPDTVCLEADRFASCPAFGEIGERDLWVSLTRVRTQLDARAGPRLAATLVYDHELRLGILDTLEDQLGGGLRREELLDLEDDIHILGLRDDSEHARWHHRIYRGNLRYEGRRLEAVLGRQRIAWGVARLWNPIDRLNAIPPLALEPDESPGVDALDLKWRFSDLSLLEAVYAPGASRAESAYALRLHGVWRDRDLSLLLGRFERAWTTGIDLAANLREGVIRLEAVYASPRQEVWPVGASRPRELDSFWQIVASYDRRLELGSGLYLLVEHLYNGNALGFGRGRAGPLLALFESSLRPPAGVPPPLGATGPFVRPATRARFGGSQVVTASEHQTGIQLSYEPTPSLFAEMLLIGDWNGSSIAWFPSLRYSGFASLEIVAGVQVFAGPRRSAFGDADPLFFLLLDWYH